MVATGTRRLGIEAVLLGTGTSVGVPFIGCDCAVCTSTDPRNHRLRSSVLLRGATTQVLVDCGPDFRRQALAHDIRRLDAVILSHEHADHILGLDDLRLLIVRAKVPMPIWGNRRTLSCVKRVFAYAFDGVDTGSFKPSFDLHEVHDPLRPLHLGEFEIHPIPVDHGPLTVLGVRVGGFAYIPDTNGIPPASRERLRGLDTLVIDGLRRTPHATHFSGAQALEVVADLKPRQAWFTHLTHDWDATTGDAELPDNVHLAYDGLVLPIVA